MSQLALVAAGPVVEIANAVAKDVLVIFVAVPLILALAIIALVLTSVLRGRAGRRHRASLTLTVASIALSTAAGVLVWTPARGLDNLDQPFVHWALAPLVVSLVAALVLWLKGPTPAATPP